MMMLTVTQPAPYGHKSVHDLPTPPSTSRPSPPPAYQEQPHRGLSHAYQIPDQSVQPMSAPHRGLPPPAAMGLQPQQPPSNAASQPAHQSHPPQPPPSLSMPPHAHSHSQPSGHLPPPPQQWQGGEEHMKTWLVAKAEEEKTKQEEERTRQEQLRLEQRKIEGDILRSSLSGGIPPPLIPLVFAGMGSSGGAASKTAMEWAQQYLSSAQGYHPQLLPAAGTVSPEHQRDYATPGGSHYPAGTPGPSGGLTAQGSFTSHTGSPTRPRGQTMSGPLGRVSSGLSNFPAGVAHQGSGSISHQQQGPGHTQQGQQEPPLYFHHWQPPSTQGGSSSNPPGTPSGEVPRKRKAPGPQHPGSGTGDQRLRSPPVLMYSNPGTRGHKRQRSDMSWRHSSPSQGEWAESREPRRRSLSPQRESTAGPGRTLVKGEGGGHSVSSLLSAESEPAVDRYRPRQQTPTHQPQHYEPGPQRAGPAYARYVSEGQEDSRRTPPAPELSRGKGDPGPRE